MTSAQTPPSAGLSVEKAWNQFVSTLPDGKIAAVKSAFEFAFGYGFRAGQENTAITEHVRTVLEAEIPDLLERAPRGETLTASERSALTGYELGWRDGYRTRVKSLTEQRDKAVEGIKKATGDPWGSVVIFRATLAATEGEGP